ncbi:M23 family metallopeptidase [Microbacterium sp. STN6]|uniref:peptidoglycan DD-metalloendopeptidase family protein n=1 Tax=Microbacterium sp. STN6 TaxID=2995588 RepID=UPI002260F3AD|nr:M23 family metallopeptidase [Microbacterium sp. STN6]MCX7523052.1 M23 family metallopeptidase [Microbacterium sp. STN6]
MKRTEPTTGRARARGRLGMAIATVIALATVGLVAEPAWATDYPSWQDVQNAKSNQAAASAEVSKINALIANLNAEVAQTQAEAVKRGDELSAAQDAFDKADIRANDLQTQADKSRAEADAATAQAGRLAAQLYRTGGANLTMNIFLSAGPGTKSKKPDQLLSDLGSMTKLVEHSSGVYKTAVTARNSADALSAQAAVAKTERETLRVAAQKALEAAAAAAKAAQDKLAEQQKQQVVLQAQLAALTDKTATTVAGYQAGVAARAAAAAAAAAAAGGAGLPGGWVGSQGWAIPARGPITGSYGARPAPCYGCSSYHLGVDIGAGYHAGIYAAAAGVVSYAGPASGYGNLILINHGGGIVTAYGHMERNQIFVGIGQRVVAGEAIARVGSQGHSTGPHLHFEVRVNGSKVNPITFMRARGAPLG